MSKLLLQLAKIIPSRCLAAILLTAFIVSCPTHVGSQGLTIPVGSSLSVGGSDLNVPGFVTIAGTLSATTGSVSLTGDWTNSSGVFMAGSSTVIFSGTGTQNINTGGIGSGKLFFNFSHSGTGDAILTTTQMNIDNNFTSTAGTFNTGGFNITVAGDWSNTNSTFTHGSATVTFDGTTQSINGNTTFWNWTKIATATDTLTFDNSGEQIIQNMLTLRGASAGQLLALVSDSPGDQWNITLQAGGFQDLEWLDVTDSDANNGLTLVGRNSVGLAQNNINWSFGAATLTWDGDTSADWETASNWDLGFVPQSIDSVVIADVTTQPDLTTVTATFVTVVDMTINAGASISLSGKNLHINGILSSNGTIFLNGSENVTIVTPDTDSGAFYFGDADAVVENPTIPDLNYFDVVISDANGEDTYATPGNLSIFGELSLTNATFDISTGTDTITVSSTINLSGGDLLATNGDIDLNGDLILTAGTLTAPTTSETFTISGDFTHSTGGTFTNSSGTVTFDGTMQNIFGNRNTTFYGFNKTATATDTMRFTTSAEQTITNSLTINGVSAARSLTLLSNVGGTQFDITLTTGGLQDLEFLIVGDSDASGGLPLIARTSSESPTSSTANWFFNSGTFTWEGDVDQDWDTALNWNVGLLPIPGDSVIVPVVATVYPVLASAVDVDDLSVASTATVTLAGFGLEVDDVFSLDGSIRLIGSETVTIPNMDEDSGTFAYIGNTDATADARSIVDIASTAGSIDYYNLLINDTGSTPDNFTTNGDLVVANDLTLLNGVLNISTNGDALTVTNTLLINGGTLTATSGSIDANGDVTTSAGTLTAPNSSNTFNVAGNWTLGGSATFTHSSGTVIFDVSNSVTLTGNTTFYNFTTTTGGKTFSFTAGSTQVIDTGGTLTANGEASNNITMQSTSSGSDWTWEIPDANQGLNNLIVSDGEVETTSTNNFDIFCFGCTDGTGNDNTDPASTPQWVFSSLAINVPQENKTVDRTPTIIGTADPGDAITVQANAHVIGTATADSAGNWRFEVAGSDQLTIGSTSLTAFVSGVGNTPTPINVVSAPTTSQQPTITSHTENERVLGATPTIAGASLASSSAEILASDADGNLLLTTVGTGTSTAGGIYSIALTIPLPKGTNSISVTVDGVASDILDILLVDPFGVVFDSSSNLPIEGAEVSIFTSGGTLAVAGVHLHATDVNPLTTGSDGVYSFLTVSGDYTIDVTAAGFTYPSSKTTFPSDRTIVNGSKGELFTVASTVIEMDHPMDENASLLRLEKSANKKEVKIGEVVTYTITIENLNTENSIGDFRVWDTIPPGFKYIDDRVILDGVPIDDPTGRRPVGFDPGTMGPGQTKTLKYQLVVGSGVTFGDYRNTAVARLDDDSSIISNTASETVEVVMDPLFDLGTIIGKVFYDQNENGIQDAPVYDFLKAETITEDPISNARIVMEDGTIITADANGLFSVPGITPGRHLFRIDERSLPKDSYLTTPKVVVVDVTQGSTYKVNFGVHVDYEVFTSVDNQFFAKQIGFNQDTSKPTPRLNADYFGDGAVVYNRIFIDPIEFRFFTNYGTFVDQWRLEIFEELTKKTMKTFEGTNLNIYDPVFWDGRNNDGEYVDPDKKYQYIFTVYAGHKYDETKAKDIALRLIEDEEEYDQYMEERKEKIEREGYKDWIIAQNKINNLGIQTIFVEGETITVDQKDESLYSIQILQDNNLVSEIPVVYHHGLTAREIIETGQIQETEAEPIDIILPRGDYEIMVQTARDVPQARESYESITIDVDRSIGGIEATQEEVVYAQAPSKQYKKQVRIGEDYLFFVGMGDIKAGYNFVQGNIEPVINEDRFTSGFYRDGQVSYYLKGKIKGKYLITSSFDSDRERKQLFRNLDEDTYYPVYGDQSEVDYDATDTQGNLYLMMEWDKSSVQWSNYSVGFEDTEFARYTRSLYGGKINFESVGTTEFGEAKTKIVAFRARAQQKNAHNEFLATGGSLYYLRHKKIVEGSDSIKIEVRDKITGLVISSKEMVEGADYEMDYEQGRMLFWKPIQTIVQAYSIINDDLLDGNLVYVVADYEYEVLDKIDEATYGARVRQALGDNVIVGGTVVEESQEGGQYRMQGIDLTIQPNQNTKIVAEYAMTEDEEEGVFISTDGGLSFTEINTEGDARGAAYSIKGDTRLFDKLAVKAGYRWVGNDFSSSATTAQQGKEITNIEAIYDPTDSTRITVRHDIQALIDDGNLQSQAQVGASKSTTSLIQMVHEARRLKLTAEYQRTEVENKKSEFDTANNTETNTVAVRADYKLSDKVDVSLRQQITIDGEDNDQTTIGVVAKPTDKITVKGEKTIGESGFMGDLDVRVDTEGPISFVGGYKLHRDKDGTITQDQSGDATAGVVMKVTESTEVKTEFGLEGVFEEDPRRVVKLGTASALGDKNKIETELALRDGGGSQSTALGLKGVRAIDENNRVEGEAVLSSDQGHQQSAYAMRGISKIDENTQMETELILDGPEDNRQRTMTFGGTKQVDENTKTTSKFALKESPLDGRESNFTVGTNRKINEELAFASSRIFGTKEDGTTTNETAYSLIQNKDGQRLEGKYGQKSSDGIEDEVGKESTFSLIREREGQKLEGTLTRKDARDDQEISKSNIFGLSGDFGDKWALEGNIEQSNVQNLDGSETDRNVVSVAAGYVNKDDITGEELKASSKFEIRMDRGDTDKRQVLAYNAIEGKVNRDLTLSGKAEISETRNLDTDEVEAQHREFSLGAAYRPIMNDRLNFLAQYTYQEDLSPSSQEDIEDIEEVRAHVLSADVIFDLTEKWQIAEKFAYRISEEKVTGFDFTETHTWLMIQRLTYNVDKDWAVTGELRMLGVEEAEDYKAGGLFEVVRNVGDYTQLGLGYNFTDFTDDLTDLDYSTHGPFIRMTGKLYDRTPEELERSRQAWIDEKVRRWATAIVYEQLEQEDSEILIALNENIRMAQYAEDKGDLEEARKIYKDVVIAAEMMFAEASQYIRARIGKEEELKQMKVIADQYYKNGQYEKARKILEKIVEEAEKVMLEYNN